MSNINLSSGLPETVLDPPPADAAAALDAALAAPEPDRRDRVSAVVAGWPQFLAAWAWLGDLARDDVEAYACYRVGYHRGLDQLRRSARTVSWSVPGARPTPRSIRPGNSLANVPNCSAMTSGA